VQTVSLFARVGEGTLAPWDPTSKLVVRGPYRRVRNPMISGVLFVLLGEAAILGAPALLIWAAAFLAVNAAYMPLFEEPGLRRRFGEDYDVYKANVPRWLPRVTPWDRY
jgi:protein-S-isoprenylcysteine O-methyltransferase Ste14